MIEEIRDELKEAENHDDIKTWVYIKHVSYLLGEVERKDKQFAAECKMNERLVNEVAKHREVLEWYAGHRFDDGERARKALK